ncbi:MAG: hypothetical protein ACON5F_13075 [Jejuia sp.]
MKTQVFRSMVIIIMLIISSNAEAQFLKKLKDKVNRKIEQKVDQTVDQTLDDLTTKTPKEETERGVKIEDNTTVNSASGSAIIKHSAKYGSYSIKEFGKANLNRSNDEVRIYGSWVTHAADIYDGYILVVPKGNALLFDKNGPKQKQIKLRIPDEASLKLSYDPIWTPESGNGQGLYTAVTEDYQSFNLESGEVVIDVLSETNIQLSFSGNAQLVTLTKNPDKNSENEYLESYTSSSVDGAIDVSPVTFIDSRTVTKTKKSNTATPKLSDISSNASTPGVYNFTFETQVKLTNLKENESYNMSYLFNPNTEYFAMKADMAEYSDAEMDGESLIVMDGSDVHIFVETQGMKMRMSQGMMGGKQMQNPSEEMANYDYTNLQKTGKTKTILGATCYEHVMSDNNVKINLWVAPSVNLPNWFIQNTTVLDGHIMEYTLTSKDGSMKSETIAINDNISKTINPKDYRKMF